MDINYLEKITEIHAFISVDEGGEGIVSAIAPNGMSVPLISADIERFNSLLPLAKKIARESGATIKVIKFSHREVIQEIKP